MMEPNGMTTQHPCARRWMLRWIGLRHTWNGSATCALCDVPTPKCGAVGGGVWGHACTKRKGHGFQHRAVTSTTRTNGRITSQSTERWGGEPDPDEGELEFFEDES